MKGKLIKKDKIWYVVRIEEGDWETYYPLNPYDVQTIEEQAKVFDNIEARIAAWPDVEFEIENFWETGIENPFPVATLLQYKLETETPFENVEDMIRHSDEVWSDLIPELSDEEIEKAAANLANPNADKTDNWIEGAKWYREQLKNKKYDN